MFTVTVWLEILMVSICVLSSCSLGATVNDLKLSDVECSAVLVDKMGERMKNPDLANKVTTTNEIDYKKATSIFDFIVKDTYGVDMPLGDYCKGYVTLVVNIASTCGFANINYAQLTMLDKEFGDKLRILSFPINQFYDRMQEGDGDEMLCHLKLRCASLGAILAKVNANGDSAIPLYKYLKEALPAADGKQDLTLNFEKFLIDKNGKPFKRYPFTATPMDMLDDIKSLL
ncbi:probable phospholipid hydroperoxide glutathione peroxidase [Contarinia nasturtii]|uniref:probable phospholipid hydroperoxide glutathione peroxidase n=1 Tax=Contarinia nasturtii TaxID=265458 RepID=UPI0012D455F4|nr:probable phospholipid hydroperoxide glutathione peroxidase [Contarinia nasturtii]